MKEGEVAELLEVRGWKGGMDVRPSTGLVSKDRQRCQQRDGREQTDGDVHIGDRAHAGDSSKDDDEAGEKISAVFGGDDGGEDEVKNVAAADELVACDGSVGEEDGDDAQDAGDLAVTRFEQVGDGELGELAGAGRDEVNEQKACQAAGSLPESSEAVSVGIFRTGEERAG